MKKCVSVDLICYKMTHFHNDEKTERQETFWFRNATFWSYGFCSNMQELMEQINAHPDDFLRLMNEPPDAQGQAMMDMG